MIKGSKIFRNERAPRGRRRHQIDDLSHELRAERDEMKRNRLADEQAERDGTCRPNRRPFCRLGSLAMVLRFVLPALNTSSPCRRPYRLRYRAGRASEWRVCRSLTFWSWGFVEGRPNLLQQRCVPHCGWMFCDPDLRVH